MSAETILFIIVLIQAYALWVIYDRLTKRIAGLQKTIADNESSVSSLKRSIPKSTGDIDRQVRQKIDQVFVEIISSRVANTPLPPEQLRIILDKVGDNLAKVLNDIDNFSGTDIARKLREKLVCDIALSPENEARARQIYEQKLLSNLAEIIDDAFEYDDTWDEIVNVVRNHLRDWARQQLTDPQSELSRNLSNYTAQTIMDRFDL
jgi:hypothetical protein